MKVTRKALLEHTEVRLQGRVAFKMGENPVRRMLEGSTAMSISCGLVDPKWRPKGVHDGLLVNIPVLINNRNGTRGLKVQAPCWYGGASG